MLQTPPPKLLISGSRVATDAMVAFTERIVLATLRQDADYPSCFGCSIIVGDAVGVDDAAVNQCQTLGLTFVCYGKELTPRNCCHERDYVQLAGYSYPARDWYMARQCDLCIAIWNGYSKGTMITYNAAVKLGKKAKLVNFGKKKKP